MVLDQGETFRWRTRFNLAIICAVFAIAGIGFLALAVR